MLHIYAIQTLPAQGFPWKLMEREPSEQSYTVKFNYHLNILACKHLWLWWSWWNSDLRWIHTSVGMLWVQTLHTSLCCSLNWTDLWLVFLFTVSSHFHLISTAVCGTDKDEFEERFMKEVHKYSMSIFTAVHYNITKWLQFMERNTSARIWMLKLAYLTTLICA